jgi:hypothetical protein
MKSSTLGIVLAIFNVTVCHAKVTLTINSDPPGAAVVQAGEVLGYTPVDLEYPNSIFKQTDSKCGQTLPLTLRWSSGATAGPGGPAYDGPGGPAYSGSGGACYAGPGGPMYDGPGGAIYNGPGGPAYDGPGGPAYDGPGGACYAGPGGPAYAGPGGPCYDGPGGTGDRCPVICR